MLFFKTLQLVSVALSLVSGLHAQVAGTDSPHGRILNVGKHEIVTWDDHSLLVNGKRLMVFSGEVHPFRMPVQSHWLDILQKMKASGYNAVSIYVMWALLEGKPGQFRADGIFDLKPFFDAAQKVGLYLWARPGNYINAECSGGGFPGWLTRTPGALRTNTDEYIQATDLYTREIGKIIAASQITEGGPILLFQPENEYQHAIPGYDMPSFPYWQTVVDQYRNQSIVVPFVNNEAHMFGYITPHTPASVDIYGFDGYPLGFDCENPSVWPANGLPTDWLAKNTAIAPDTPVTIPEFQGGGFQQWGQAGFENCALLLNMEFERVLYKNNYAAGATLFNIYMTYGGTNWGNLGHADGFTSYDYGAQITEERQLWREKYSEVKLQANFFHVSPAFLEADRFNPSLEFTDTDAITVTPATTHTTKFYISRHTKYETTESVPYKLKVSTVHHGDIVIPQLGGTLVLNRRDSKIHVSDYPVGREHLIYSSAEVFTWKEYHDKTVLVLYGGPNEHHELAVKSRQSLDDTEEEPEVEGEAVTIQRATTNDYTIISWDISDNVRDRKVVRVNGNFYIYLLNRNEAYNFWVPPTGAGSDYGTSDIILKAGYLIRTAQREGQAIHLVGDVNATTPIEIIGGAPAKLESLTFNGEPLEFEQSALGVVTATVDFTEPEFTLPALSGLTWKKIDSLPELSANYDDSAWVDTDIAESPNDAFPPTTPMSLYTSDYGFHSGSALFRGHFTATGEETTFNITVQGGRAFGSSVWLGSTFLGSWTGGPQGHFGSIVADLPQLEAGQEYIFTVVMDHMGLNGNYVIGEDILKVPRGILEYDLAGHDASDIKWRITGNLGGEDYVDITRGPLNEGGMYAERQGFHQPSPPSDDWETGNPTAGVSKPGITFYTTSFDLDIPRGYDIPLSIQFDGDVSQGAFRVQLFVNGYQYGKFVPHIGPQSRFPIPEGILNHHGTNTIGLTVWAMGEEGAKLSGMEWDVSMPTITGFGDIELAPAPAWQERQGAY